MCTYRYTLRHIQTYIMHMYTYIHIYNIHIHIHVTYATQMYVYAFPRRETVAMHIFLHLLFFIEE